MSDVVVNVDELEFSAPKMTYKKACAVWGQLVQDQKFRGFLHAMELTDEWILDTNIGVESGCILPLSMCVRRGSFFAKLLTDPRYSEGQYKYVIETLLRLVPGQLLAWHVSRKSVKDILKHELPQISYFLYALAIAFINCNPYRDESEFPLYLNPLPFSNFKDVQVNLTEEE